MQAIHSIQTVTGPTLTIAVPAAFEGKHVKVVVEPVDAPTSTAKEE